MTSDAKLVVRAFLINQLFLSITETRMIDSGIDINTRFAQEEAVVAKNPRFMGLFCLQWRRDIGDQLEDEWS